LFYSFRTLNNTSGDSHDQSQGHISSIVGQYTGRIGDGDAKGQGSFGVDMIKAIAEIRDELELWTGLIQNFFVNLVGDCGNQNVSFFDGLHQVSPVERSIPRICAAGKQLLHASLDNAGQLPCDDHQRFGLSHDVCVIPSAIRN
jgi:hypothetical protein